MNSKDLLPLLNAATTVIDDLAKNQTTQLTILTISEEGLVCFVSNSPKEVLIGALETVLAGLKGEQTEATVEQGSINRQTGEVVIDEGEGRPGEEEHHGKLLH
jgi:hypothetical protein